MDTERISVAHRGIPLKDRVANLVRRVLPKSIIGNRPQTIEPTPPQPTILITTGKTKLPITEIKPPVEDERKSINIEVFETWLRGNVTVPQADSIIDASVLNAFFQHLAQNPTDSTWSDFMNSKMNHSQLSRLGKVMSDMHHHYSIKLATAEHQRDYTDQYPEGTLTKEGVTHDMVMPPERLERYWDSVKNHCQEILIRHMSQGMRLAESTALENEADAKINAFLVNPDFAERRNALVDILSETVRLVHSDEGKQLTFNYRHALNFTYIPDDILHPKEPTAADAKEILDLMKLKMEYEEKKKLHPKVTSKEELSEVLTFLRDKLETKFPGYGVFYWADFLGIPKP